MVFGIRGLNANMLLSDYPPELLKDINAWLWKPIYTSIFKKRQHFSLVVVGKPGSGKSYLSIYIAWLFYPNIDIQKSVVYSAGELANLVNQKLPKGFPIIIDDAGLTAGGVDAMTKEVKAIGKILQSIRSRNLLIILNLPNLFLLAKNIRTLIDYYAEPIRLNTEEGICHAKFRILKVNPLSGIVYRYSPTTIQTENHWTGYKKVTRVKRTTFAFKKAPEEILKVYEQHKSDEMMIFNDKQDKMLNKSSSDLQTKRNEKVKSISEELKKDISKYKDEEGNIHHIKIATDFNVPKSIVSDALDLAGFKKRAKKKRNPFGPGLIIDVPKSEESVLLSATNALHLK